MRIVCACSAHRVSTRHRQTIWHASNALTVSEQQMTEGAARTPTSVSCCKTRAQMAARASSLPLTTRLLITTPSRVRVWRHTTVKAAAAERSLTAPVLAATRAPQLVMASVTMAAHRQKCAQYGRRSAQTFQPVCSGLTAKTAVSVMPPRIHAILSPAARQDSAIRSN